MKDFFTPDYYVADLQNCRWQILADRGIQVIFLDIDNTLERHGSERAGVRTKAITDAAKTAGLKVYILSNAKQERAERFCEALGLDYLGAALKPLGFRVRRLLRELKIKPGEAVMVGDQIFTDHLCARFCRMPMLFVQSLGGAESAFIRYKRKWEGRLASWGADPRLGERLD